MSLKAKIEAVIYASEEPVTLTQLTGLLGHEAQAELDALEARQQQLPIETAAGEEPADAPSESIGEAARNATEPDTPEAGSAADRKRVREQERRLREYLQSIVDELERDFAGNRGLEVRQVAGGYRMATKPEYHDAVRGFIRSLKPALKLSLQALETLAVVAYKQPVTAPEISEIRGVDSGGVLGSLMARKLVTTAGRKQVIGRPILYRTTKDFLLRFGLKDISELPSIEEFERMATELAEQEEITMPERTAEDAAVEERLAHEDLLPERDATEAQPDGDSGPLDEADSQTGRDRLPDEASIVDGRLSGVATADEQSGRAADDPSAPSAAEAATQDNA